MENEKCDHEYFHESTHYNSQESGYRMRKFMRLDVYYCHKCLDKKDVERSGRADSDDAPMWWRH